MHNRRYLTYPCRASKTKVQKELDRFVAHEDEHEGAIGLPNPIRWIDYLCKNLEEAEGYIKSHDSGWYDSLAVKYKLGRKIMWLVKIEYHT